ncbi:hypothetical protein CH341_26500 [Rhodoplanes roseus]|uniref:Uncharacterized protein n=1 Tax=Rhodoplanes roseus TaxID=29409 RepID=A0A327KK02_9BRAD|nr:hypothetical protein CH341_26500 [Rhodoplanes roseus]
MRRLFVSGSTAAPIAGRFKTAPLFIPAYRSGLSIRINARPAGHALARRQLGRLLDARRRVS